MKKKRLKKAVVAMFVFVAVFCLSGIMFNLLFPLSFERDIMRYSREFSVAPELIASVIKAESRFDKNAKSSKGAVGLMQVMPETAKWISSEFLKEEFDEEKLLNPAYNIKIGTRYLKYLIDKYADETTILACYNAGEGVVKTWAGENNTIEKTQIQYAETLKYVQKVQNQKKIYKFKLKRF